MHEMHDIRIHFDLTIEGQSNKNSTPHVLITLDIDLVKRQRGRFVPTSVHRYKVKHQSNMSAKISE